MAEPLAEAYVRVRPDTRDFKDELKRDIENSGVDVEGDKQGKQFGDKFTEGATERIRDSRGRFSKTIGDAIEPELAVAGKKSGKSFLDGFFNNISDAAHNAPFWAKLLVGATPILAPAVGAALLGGLGLGVIGAGIVGQLHSPEVEAGFARFKADAGAVFTEATKPFGGVITRELTAADDLLHKVQPQLAGMFAKVTPSADHFFAGLNGLVESALPGLDKGLDGAKIVLDELGRDLPAVGKAIGDAFANATSGAEGEAKALHDLLFILDQLVAGAGAAAGASGQLYNMLRDIATLNFDDLKKSNINLNDVVQTLTTGGIEPAAKAVYHYVAGSDKAKESQDAAAKSAKELTTNMQVQAASIDIAGGKAATASQQYGMLVSQLKAVNNTADTVAGAMTDAIINPMLQSDMAANNFNKSLITLGDTLVANGGHLSDHVKQLKKSETGQQQNKDAILAVVQANLQQYDSQIAVGLAASDAAAKYDANTKALEDQLHAAGYTAAQIDDLIGKYRNVPDKVDTNIAINGLTDAINDLDDLIRKINGLHDKTITIQGHVYTNVDPSQLGHGLAKGGIRHAAVGMLIPPSDPGTVLVGEPQTHGEALIPLAGISQMRAAELGQVALGGYGLDVVPRAASGQLPAALGGRSGGLAATAPVITLNARVFIGDREITDIVRVEVDAHDQQTAGAVSGGVRD